jgi:hypothetical protein
MHDLTKISSITLLCMLMLSLCFLSAQQATAQIDPTVSKLQAADNALNIAFNEILDAEKAGANVTELLSQFNCAAEILAQAGMDYRKGNFSDLESRVDSVLPIAQQITVSAQSLKQAAPASSQNSFWSLIAFTVVGIVVFLAVLYMSWRWTKQRYVKGLLNRKPEVVNQ